MNAIFIHDHRFIRLNNELDKVYAEGKFSYGNWKRYLTAFDHLTVVGRQEKKQNFDETNLTVSSGDNVDFQLLPDLSGITKKLNNRKANKEKLRNLFKNADAVIARLHSELGLLAITVAEEMGKPWAIEVAGCAFDSLWNYGKLAAKIYAPVMMWRVRKKVKKALFALYVTHDFLQNRYPNKNGHTSAISNVEISIPEQSFIEEKKKRYKSNKPLTLGLIGTLYTDVKGIQTVFKALSEMNNEVFYPQITFRVLGEGDQERWIRLAKSMGIEEKVHFDGVLPSGQAVMKWLDQIDIYLQPSFQEGLPRATIEAMSRGCIAIGSTAGGIPELLPDDCLHKPGDHKKLGRIIRHAIQKETWGVKNMERNYKESQKYDESILKKERKKFWLKFAKYVGAKN